MGLIKNKMKPYCLGFLFNSSKSYVWLIKKNKPDFQKGKYNGIGGSIEIGESYEQAMEREFFEEAGLKINTWIPFCRFTDDVNWEVVCYYAMSDEVAITKTDELVSEFSVNFLPQNIMKNLKWLIPMALNFNPEKDSKFFVIDRTVPENL